MLRSLAAASPVVVASLVALGSSAAFAQARDDAPLFPRGSTNLQLYGSFADGWQGDEETYHSFTGALGYHLFDNFSINFGLTAHRVLQPTEVEFGSDDTFAGEFAALLRWHFFTRGDFSLFVDGGSGVFYADDNVPGEGTRFNFTPQGGLGVTYRFADRWHLIAGGRWFHVSNAGIQGPDRHPGSNAAMGYVGVMWEF